MHPVLAHGSGIDELLVLAIPFAVFGVLLLLGKRKDGDDATEGESDARED